MTGLRCMCCGRRYEAEPGRYVCSCRSNVGSDLGALDVEYDYAAIASEARRDAIAGATQLSMARYGPLLPLRTVESLPRLPVGNTPLLPSQRLGASIGCTELYIKDDGRNPTGSLKDRASAIAVARAVDEGAAAAATASTGNAAAALAGLAASAGLPCVIFVPERAPQAKLAQLLVFGAKVYAIRGSYDQAFDLCTEACAEFGWYNRNTGYNPFMSEGKKTVAYEIALQMHAAANPSAGPGFMAPDVVVVSVGDGCIIGGVYKGFYDLQQLGWIERIPRIIGVQSERSDALYQAWRKDLEIPEPVEATTRADSINVNSPRDARKALRAVRQSNGAFVLVSDQEILAAIRPMAQYGAVFAEPAGAASLAGLQEAIAAGIVGVNESIVLINTGSGLKDVAAAMQVTGGVTSIAPAMSEVRKQISGDVSQRR